jgi:hypothetical protein
MTSPLLKASEGRSMLLLYKPGKEALIQAIEEQNRIKSGTKKRLKSLIKFVNFCERDEKEIELVSTVIDAILKSYKPPPEDIVRSLEIVDMCRNDIVELIKDEFKLGSALPPKKDEEFDQLYSSIISLVGKEEISSKREKIQIIKDLIYGYPGLYITTLWNRTITDFGETGFTYPTIWRYVEELQDEGEIVTVGGPKGSLRYCFPNPSKISDRSFYYNKYFLIKGKIEKQVTHDFNTANIKGKQIEIYLVNSHVKPLFLALDWGALSKLENSFIESYGVLKPYTYLTETKRISPKKGTKKLKGLDLMIAYKVSEKINGTEKRSWVSEKAVLPQESILLEPNLVQNN